MVSKVMVGIIKFLNICPVRTKALPPSRTKNPPDKTHPDKSPLTKSHPIMK
jgi:hypothetical protein